MTYLLRLSNFAITFPRRHDCVSKKSAHIRRDSTHSIKYKSKSIKNKLGKPITFQVKSCRKAQEGTWH